MQSHRMNRPDDLDALGNQVMAPVVIKPVKTKTRSTLCLDVERMENPIVTLPAPLANVGRQAATDQVYFVKP